jgi:hypothetical protein
MYNSKNQENEKLTQRRQETNNEKWQKLALM